MVPVPAVGAQALDIPVPVDYGTDMSTGDAKKVAAVLANVDGGCISCATAAAAHMTKQFPDFDWPQLVADADGCWTPDLLRSPA
jgi:hypothetical protein